MSRAQVTGFDEIAEFAERTRPKTGPKCRVCSLPPDLLKKVHYTYLVSKTGTSGIARYLKANGHPAVKRHSLNHHFSEGHHE